MKVLIAHARYAQPGGEEQVVKLQEQALTERGHEVVRYEVDNAALRPRQLATGAVWSRTQRRAVADVLRAEQPDLMHVHNTFPALSPSIYGAAQRAGVRVVQHLHNARLVCIQPFLLRDGRACTDCVDRRLPMPGVTHGCYRGSRLQSGAATAVQLTQRLVGTGQVDLFIAVSDHIRRVVPVDAAVCHNALASDPGARAAAEDRGYAMFVGRLSPEKGVDVLLDAAATVPMLPVVIVGDGPERGALEDKARRLRLGNVEFVGRVEHTRVLELLRGARVVVAPSIGQEPFGLSIVEAAAVGVPAIAARAGGLPEVVADGETGMLVPAGDASALAAALSAALDAARMARLGAAARARFEREFTVAAFGERLLALYAPLLAQAP